MRIHPSEQGLAGFTFQNRFFFYRNCPFGAVFSQHCLFHEVIFTSHAVFLFVDDFLLTQNCDILPVSAVMISMLCLILKVPISWKICTLGPQVVWIGWRFDLSEGLVSLHPNQRQKLLQLIDDLLKHRKVS